MLGEPKNRPRAGGGKKSVPQGLPVESTPHPGPGSVGVSSPPSVHQKQFGVPKREDRDSEIHSRLTLL